MEKIERFVGENSFLSNFYPCKVKIDDMVFSNAEAAFQSRRTTSEQQRRFFQNMLPSEARRSGAKLTQRPDWDAVKVEEMRTVLRAKFADPDMKAKLLATSNATIINTDDDTFWGVHDDKGENQLGKLLTAIRDELHGSTSSNAQKQAENSQTADTTQSAQSEVVEQPQDDEDGVQEDDDTQGDDQGNGKKKKKHKK